MDNQLSNILNEIASEKKSQKYNYNLKANRKLNNHSTLRARILDYDSGDALHEYNLVYEHIIEIPEGVDFKDVEKQIMDLYLKESNNYEFHFKYDKKVEVETNYIGDQFISDSVPEGYHLIGQIDFTYGLYANSDDKTSEGYNEIVSKYRREDI